MEKEVSPEVCSFRLSGKFPDTPARAPCQDRGRPARSVPVDSVPPVEEAAINTLANSAPRRLCRSRDHRLIAGVASGVAAHFGISTAAVRTVFVLLIGVSQLGLLLYAAFWMALPPDRPTVRLLPHAMLRLIGGGSLIAVAITGGGMLAAAFVIGAGVIIAKLLMGAVCRMRAERLGRIREQQRARRAVLVHDEVLQTLALVQRNCEDAEAVQRLIAAQERSLR